MLSNDVNTMAPLASAWYQRLIARLLVATLTGYLAATFAVIAPRSAPMVPG